MKTSTTREMAQTSTWWRSGRKIFRLNEESALKSSLLAFIRVFKQNVSVTEQNRSIAEITFITAELMIQWQNLTCCDGPITDENDDERKQCLYLRQDYVKVVPAAITCFARSEIRSRVTHHLFSCITILSCNF